VKCNLTAQCSFLFFIFQIFGGVFLFMYPVKVVQSLLLVVTS
jgi:hypothetical protein